MVQKEVAERILSQPGVASYGILTLKVRHYFIVKKVMQVAPHLFRPQPQIDSTVIMLSPRADCFIPENHSLYWQIVESAFHSRRKTLKNNLKSILSAEEMTILSENLQINSAIKFNLSSRGEILDEKDYILLYHLIGNIRNNRR